MAKISPIAIKYVIHARFEADGPVEKPDVIGAIFGQTEGLLGSDLEMRQLQKEGRIGRIEATVETKDRKTVGKIEVPSALDKEETSIIAAALETIERIGPANAKIWVESIEDVRKNKRKYIVERAKKLLEEMEKTLPDSRELEEAVKIANRLSKLQSYGKEKLPAGDLSKDEIIVVEGRADVINLLKAGIDNVIGMNGTILPETIKELGKEKTLILFVDGDRGGKLIAKNVLANANIKYVAFAPDGKEVEELSPKEILACLRKKIPSEELTEKKSVGKKQRKVTRKRPELPNTELLERIANELKEKQIALLDGKLNKIAVIPLAKLRNFRGKKKILGMVLNGQADREVIKSAERLNVKFLGARNFFSPSQKVELIPI